MDEFQRRGTTFPLNIETRHKKSQFFTLMDMGAMCSCINYNTFHKLNVQLTQREVPKVMDALKMDTLRRLYMIVVQNIHKAREKLPKKEDEPHNFKVNDMVLVKDPDAAVFKPRYQPNFRVTAIFGNNRIEVQDK